jgi:hypothetical protein
MAHVKGSTVMGYGTNGRRASPDTECVFDYIKKELKIRRNRIFSERTRPISEENQRAKINRC